MLRSSWPAVEKPVAQHCLIALVLLGLIVGTACAQENGPPQMLLQQPVDAEPLPVPVDATSETSIPQEVIPLSPSSDPADVQLQTDGGMISLTARNAPLRNVVALIADAQKLNIVFAAAVETPITATLAEVPWQQALDSLLSVSGYTWTLNKGIIFVSSAEIAESIAPEVSGLAVELFELDFASAVDVDQTVKGLLSPAGKSWIIETSSQDNRQTREAVVVNDYVGRLQQIRNYICQADQPPRQVLVEARILQVDLSDDCRHGVNFDQLLSFSGNQLTLESKGFANAAASPAFFMTLEGGSLNGLVELLQSTTDAKTLASPRLLVMNGQEANIQIGGRFGYRVTTTTQTSTLESVQFLDVGVVLTLAPRITRDGRVLMRIKPKVSTGEVSPETGLPSEETTEVETDVIVTDGQGVVIGGLIQEKDSIIQSKIPWLGDIPYLGVLFQKRQKTVSRTEIIVTLIPHIQPYTPIVAGRDQHEVMRVADPLTVGAIGLYPRPYEPRMPDALTNPRGLIISHHFPYHNPQAYVVPGRPVLMELPTVQEQCPDCPPDISSTLDELWPPSVSEE